MLSTIAEIIRDLLIFVGVIATLLITLVVVVSMMPNSNPLKRVLTALCYRLGKDEALRRLKNGLGSASANFGHVFKVEEQIWTGPHLQYRISALGQVASGSIDVAEDYVRLEVFLPWLLAKLAETLQALIRKLLEKK